MIEFYVDMSYLIECDELDKVVLNDECGENEPMEFVPKVAATLCEYTYEQWRAINEIVGNAMEYAHDIAIMHPDKADPCWDLSNYVDQILEVAFDKHEHDLTPEQAIAATVGGEANVRGD